MRRFSIRDLFWLTLVVGLGLGWWVDRERLAENYDGLLAEMKLVAAERDVLDAEVTSLQQQLYFMEDVHTRSGD